MRITITAVVLAALTVDASHAQTYEGSFKVPEELLSKAREFLVQGPKQCPFHWDVAGKGYFLDRTCVRNLAGSMGLDPEYTLKAHARPGPYYDMPCDKSFEDGISVSEECAYVAAFRRVWRTIGKAERCALQYYHGEYGCSHLQPKGFMYIQPGEGPRFVDGRTP